MEIYSVTEVLGKYVDWAKIPDQVLAAACLRGTDTHTYCAGYSKGCFLLPPRGEIAGYCLSFKNWFDANVTEVLMVEKRLTNKAAGYTGQLDFLFKLITGEIALTDIKTPAAESKTWECQLAAYAALIASETDIFVDALISLRLRVYGKPAIGKRYEGSQLQAYNMFKSALHAHRYING